MGIVVKVHTFAANAVANASEVNRNFDDLYNLINGNLDSANFPATFTLNASQITITDTASNYTSTELEGALSEKQYPKGYHTIHNEVLYGSGIYIFPGMLEICGTICRNSGVLQIQSATIDDSCNMVGLTNFYLTCQRHEAITGSDIFCIARSSITVTASTHINNGGLYYNGKRVFAAFYQAAVATFSPQNDDFNPAPPSTPFIRNITKENEASALGFSNFAYIGVDSACAGVSTGTYIYGLTRIFNPNKSKYGYELDLVLTSSTERCIIYNNGNGSVNGREFHVTYENLDEDAVATNRDAKAFYTSGTSIAIGVSVSDGTPGYFLVELEPKVSRFTGTSGVTTH